MIQRELLALKISSNRPPSMLIKGWSVSFLLPTTKPSEESTDVPSLNPLVLILPPGNHRKPAETLRTVGLSNARVLMLRSSIQTLQRIYFDSTSRNLLETQLNPQKHVPIEWSCQNQLDLELVHQLVFTVNFYWARLISMRPLYASRNSCSILQTGTL
jgi:hypothetical protein